MHRHVLTTLSTLFADKFLTVFSTRFRAPEINNIPYNLSLNKMEVPRTQNRVDLSCVIKTQNSLLRDEAPSIFFSNFPPKMVT